MNGGTPGSRSRTLRKAACLNKEAAIWTAISIFFAGLSALLGALAN